MADDIPFDKNLDFAPGQVDEPMPGVRRVMADNPGPFTFKGTLSYIIGHGKVAIVDPGPDSRRFQTSARLDRSHRRLQQRLLRSHAASRYRPVGYG